VYLIPKRQVLSQAGQDALLPAINIDDDQPRSASNRMQLREKSNDFKKMSSGAAPVPHQTMAF